MSKEFPQRDEHLAPETRQGSQQDKIRELLIQQGIENPPIVTINLFYGNHKTEGDAELLKEKIPVCDIFIPEIAGHDEVITQSLNMLSRGEITPEQFIKAETNFVTNSYNRKLLDLIYRSGKIIISPGISHEDGIFEEIKDAVQNGVFASTEDPDMAANEFSESLKQFAALNFEKRENFIADKLPGEIAEAIKDNADLVSKPEVEVLMFMGSLHGSLAARLRDNNMDVNRESLSRETIFGYSEEMLQRYKFGKEVDESLRLHAILETITARYYPSNGQYGHEQQKNRREHLSRFTDDEIRILWRKILSTDYASREGLILQALKAKQNTI